MENPPSILVTPMAPAMSAQFTRITLSNLFVRRAGPGSTELTVEGRPSDQLGRRNLTDSPVFDGRGPDASLVARVQGVATQMGDVRQLYTVVFQERPLKGSTLVTEGAMTEGSDEWAIYGGTGAFAMARGVIRRTFLADTSGGNSDELAVEVLCPVFRPAAFGSSSSQSAAKDISSTVVVTKVGVWGGEGGSAQDIATTEPPRRLQNLTVRAGVAVDSIEFTYTDTGGQTRTAGRWGGLGGNVRKLDLGDAEYVKEVSGTYGAFEGATTLTSLRIVTSTARAWGPWGIESGTRFCITAPIGSSIVGFYGRATTRLVAAIGVYLRQL
ncbi:Salt stress-induced protein [Zea mays]|uniref:Dirigent protein n=1 Tax=Zea mays TaxID=4577 RepID=A0A3L6E7K0_MAIZE|nr:Salt stress-induced protein [Zea mays]